MLEASHGLLQVNCMVLCLLQSAVVDHYEQAACIRLDGGAAEAQSMLATTRSMELL